MCACMYVYRCVYVCACKHTPALFKHVCEYVYECEQAGRYLWHTEELVEGPAPTAVASLLKQGAYSANSCEAPWPQAYLEVPVT